MRALRWLIDTAGSITGTRFRLVIASSSTATALIIGSTLASGGDSGLAAQLQQALAALGGGSSSTPAATTTAPPPSTASASKGSGGVTTVASGPVSSPSTTTTPTTKTPKTKTPKAGRVKHVFVISLNSSGFENAFGAQSEMPYLANSLRPQGELLSNYSLLTDKGLPNYLGMIGGQPPNALTSGDCTTYSEFPGNAQPDKNGNVGGDGCIYPAQAINIADQLFSARFSGGAYREDRGRRGPVPGGEPAPATPPQNCVRPDVGAPDPTQDVRKADPSTGYAGSG